MSSTAPLPDKPPVPKQTISEASLAPREGDLLSLPFDQYGRMRIAQNVLLALYSGVTDLEPGPTSGAAASVSVLDVGGYPGVLRHFLTTPAYDLSIVDVVPDDGSVPGYKQASGLELPFQQSSFDVVTSLDTLEHIPNANRELFLSELMRVARHAVVLINPVQSIQNDLAEETLNEYIRWALDARQEQLAEHREYGLPDRDRTLQAFQQAGWETLQFPTANIHNWLFMMVAKHYLISMRDERASAFERTLDRYYNLTFSQSDHAEPAYRSVLVAVRPPLTTALDRISALYPPVPLSPEGSAARLQLVQLLMSMLDLKSRNQERSHLREQLDERARYIATLEAHIASKEAELTGAQKDLQQAREGFSAELAAHKAQAAQASAQQQPERGAESAAREEYARRLEDEVKAKDEHILYLEKLLEGVEAGRVMRFARALSRFTGRR